MKKQLFVYLLLFVCASTRAQEQSKPFIYQKGGSLVTEDFNSRESLPSTNINEIPIRAVRDFTSTHVHARNVKWIKQHAMSIVLFYVDDIRMMSAYSTKGRFLYTIRYLNEKQMPPELRHQVKSSYYDYKINIIIEILFAHEFTYIVKMEDEKTYKTLRVHNGEMQVYEKYDKR